MASEPPFSVLPEDPSFPAWVPWAIRHDVAGIDGPGLYVIAHFIEAPEGPATPLSERVIYIGQTSDQTLAERWRQFHRSARTGKPSHSGGRTYHAMFGPTRIPELFVSAFPAPVPSLEHVRTYLLYMEARLLWRYLGSLARLPACNKE